MATANEELMDLTVRHLVGLQRLSKSTINKLIALLNRVDADLVEQIIKHDPTAVTGAWSQKRLEKLLEAIRSINRDAYAIVLKEFRKDLYELSNYEVQFTASSIQAALPIHFDFVTPSVEQLQAAIESRPFQGRFLRDWFKDLEEARFKRLRDATRMAFVEGESISSLIRRIRGTRANQFRDGILDIDRRGAAAIARTAITHTANYARQELYKANHSLVEKWQFIATLDSRTTLTCSSLDSKVFPVGEGPMPPRHVACRSSSVPVVRSWRSLGIDIDEAPPGTRASLNGQVAAEKNFGSWLRDQSDDFAKDWLGPNRYKLWKDGGLEVEQFTDKYGTPLTLEQLARKEKEAFRRAGIEV